MKEEIFIRQSKTIAKIFPLEKKPYYVWPSVIPFAFLYVVVTYVWLFPSILSDSIPVWVHEDYGRYYSNIPIWSMFPVVMFFHALSFLVPYWITSLSTIVYYKKRNLSEFLDKKTLLAVKSPSSPIQETENDSNQDIELKNALISSFSKSSIQYLDVIPHAHKGVREIVKLERTTIAGTTNESVFFWYQKRKFVLKYSPATKWVFFEKPSFPILAGKLDPKKIVKNYFTNSLGNGKKERNELIQMEKTFGTNKLEIPIPEFWTLFKQHALAPFFVFQVFCVLLWCLDEYWYYSLLTLFMLVFFERTVVQQRLGNLQTVRQMSMKPKFVWVFREKAWVSVLSTELLPNDLISISVPKEVAAAEQPKPQAPKKGEKEEEKHSQHAICPCDVLLLDGDCITNESMLTGESTPAMKQSILNLLSELGTDDEESTKSDKQKENENHLTMKGNKRNIVFGGTKVLKTSRPSFLVGSNSSTFGSVPGAPDDGCLGIVLRTGFETSQGKLLRTILFASEDNHTTANNNGETLYFILILLVFAVIAAAYVLYHGLNDVNKSRYKLLLNVILIITSVVPPELPMELTLAVNTSLMNLTQKYIFCTEPFRIPFAGKINVCCFDKTGTLTSDKMVLSEIVMNDSKGCAEALGGPQNVRRGLINVLGGCHSLISIEGGEVVGDNMEMAAFHFMFKEDLPKDVKKDAPKEAPIDGKKDKKKLPGYWKIDPTSDDKLKRRKEKGNLIHIVKRFPFSSKLKRMSCLVSVKTPNDSSSLRVVAKGAPEVMKQFFAKESLPENYDALIEQHTKQGSRVLAFGTKNLDSSYHYHNNSENAALKQKATREAMEKDLVFLGLAIFHSELKPLTKDTIENLINSGHKAVMITGDNPLTACHVASDLNFVDAKKPYLFLSLKEKEQNNKENGNLQMEIGNNKEKELVWANYLDLSKENSILCKFDAKKVRELSNSYNLVIIGDSFSRICDIASNSDSKSLVKVQNSTDEPVDAISSSFDVQQIVKFAIIHARVSPDHKEIILRTLKLLGYYTLMCGDGTNDVGALKQAHIGVALLDTPEEVLAKQPTPVASLGDMFKKLGEQMTKQRQFQQELMKMKKDGKPQAEIQKRSEELRKKLVSELGVVQNPFFGGAQPQNNLQQDLTSGMGDDGKPLVQLGDASIASPFTSKRSSIVSCEHIIRQGRCTLVTTLQMYKILALNSLNSAYSLSVLSMDGVKFGDTQMVIQGMGVAICFFLIARSKPLEKLSKQRPYNSVFCWNTMLSIFGQFAIHLATLVLGVQLAKLIDPLTHLDQVAQVKIEESNEFVANMTRLAAEEAAAAAAVPLPSITSLFDGSFMDSMKEMMGITKYKPTILNTIVFIITCLQSVITFACNYQGHPFMESLTQNRPLLLILGGMFSIIALVSVNALPPNFMNLELVKIPEDYIPLLLFLLISNVVFIVMYENIIKFIFPPEELDEEEQLKNN